MADDLYLRLCQVPEDDGGLPGSDDGSIPANTNIAINDFIEALFSVLHGAHSINQIKTFYNMPTAQQVTFQGILDRILAYTEKIDRVIAIHRLRAILTFHERNDDLQLNAYDTPDDVQTWIEAI